MTKTFLLFFPLVVSGLALLFASILVFRVLRRPEGDEKMAEVSVAIRDSVGVYLNRFLIWLSLILFGFIAVFALRAFMGASTTLFHILSFISGALVSLFTAVSGINMATATNTRAAWAAKHSLNRALRVAFSSGAAIGMHLVGLGLMVLTIWVVGLYLQGVDWQTISSILLYFAMGSSLVALFARIGGGIYTRAVNTGSDVLVQLESGIPQNDLRNPMLVAGNAAKNITGVTSVGADMLESYVGSIIAAVVLAVAEFPQQKIFTAVMTPLAVAGIGILASIAGTFLVRSLKNENSSKNLIRSYRLGVYLASLLVVAGSWFLLIYFLQLELTIFFALLLGLLGGIVLAWVSEYYTSIRFSPTRRVTRSSEIDAPTFLLSGLSVGMKSTLPPIIIFSAVIFFVVLFFPSMSSLYLGGMAAVGMVSTLGITLSGEAFGPIADNAANVARMSHQDESILERMDIINSLASSASTNARGFALGSAVFTALSFLAVLDAQYHLSFEPLPLISVQGFSALFVGVMLPVFFSSLSVEAVSRAALLMVAEVKRQFREISGIMEGNNRPDYKRCVQVSSTESLKKMFLPAILALAAPILVALFSGGGALFIMLLSSIATSFVFGLLLSTAGGTWASVKKFIEQGNYGGKGSAAHKSSIVGESFGNPLIDSVGPELNILIKVMVITALIFLGPVLSLHKAWFLF